MQAMFNRMCQSRFTRTGQTGKPQDNAAMTIRSRCARSTTAGASEYYVVHYWSVPEKFFVAAAVRSMSDLLRFGKHGMNIPLRYIFLPPAKLARFGYSVIAETSSRLEVAISTPRSAKNGCA